VPYSYAGTMGVLQYGSMDRRFFHRLGASLLDAPSARLPQGGMGRDHRRDAGHRCRAVREQPADPDLGSNAIVSNLHFWTRAQEAKRRGARLVAIDPYRSQTADKCHQHIALMPGTDAALALGMMHVLIGEDLVDRDYIARHTTGFAALRDRVAEFPPERVARICGIAPESVVDLARAYGTTKPAAIRLNYGMQRHAGGGNAVRASPACPRSSAHGATPRAARCSRRRAPTPSIPRRSSARTSSGARRGRST